MEWLNFQNFAEWHDGNYYDLENEQTYLDKDILVKGNKVYSPKTCVFVPKLINSLFTKGEANRNQYPIGVGYKGNKFYVEISKRNKNNEVKNRFYKGSYDTPEEAFKVYKKEKESYIKQVADDYSKKYPNFPTKLYNAMYNYKVEITD